jgi:hypothetical protein
MPKLPGLDYPISNPLSSDITLNNDQGSLMTLFTLDTTTVKAAVVEYSIIRGTTTEVGRIFIASDGTSLSFEQDKANNVDTGVSLFGFQSGSDVLVRYLSNNTGQAGTFRYSTRVLN